MGEHLIDGQFQSDKYPTTPRGKVPLSVKDSTAQDLSIAQLAWVAGIVDGEGCISLSRAYVGVNRRATESYQIRLRVRMTHRATVHRLWTMLGGTFNNHLAQNPITDKPSHLWAIHDRRALITLERLLPYLFTRREQALLAFRFDNLRSEHGPQSSWPTGRCPPALVQARHEIFEEFARLNRKGPGRN